MKIFFPGLSGEVELKKGRINSFVIENGSLMYNFVQDICSQIDGFGGRTILSEDMEQIEIGRHVDLITDVIRFEIGDRVIMNKIITKLNKIASESDYTEQFQTISTAINDYIRTLLLEFDCELECDYITVANILKGASIHFTTDYKALTEKLYARMQAVREVLGDKLYILVNIREYISEDEMKAFAKTIIDHDFRVLFVDSIDTTRLENENRIIIDNDLCEI